MHASSKRSQISCKSNGALFPILFIDLLLPALNIQAGEWEGFSDEDLVSDNLSFSKQFDDRIQHAGEPFDLGLGL